MRCDCTGLPPGEFTTTATAGALRMEKARSMGPALLASVTPGLSGVITPMGPENLSTGTVGPPPNHPMDHALVGTAARPILGVPVRPSSKDRRRDGQIKGGVASRRNQLRSAA